MSESLQMQKKRQMAARITAIESAFDLSQLNKDAMDISVVCKHNKSISPPIDLIKSGVPRVAIPLTLSSESHMGSAAAPVRTWTDAANNPSLNKKQRARIALAVCALMAPIGVEMSGSNMGTFEAPYTWLGEALGNESAEKKIKNQNDALTLLGLDKRRIRRGEQSMTNPLLTFLDARDTLWVFFMDGRVNFGDSIMRAAKKVTARDENSRPLLIDSAKRFLKSPFQLLKDCEFLEARNSEDRRAQRNTFAEELMYRFSPSREFCEIFQSAAVADNEPFVSVRVPSKNPHPLADWPIPVDLKRYLSNGVNRLEKSRSASPFVQGLISVLKDSISFIPNSEGGLEFVDNSADDASESAVAEEGGADKQAQPAQNQQPDGIEIVTQEARVFSDGTVAGMVRGVATTDYLQRIRDEQIDRLVEEAEGGGGGGYDSEEENNMYDASLHPLNENEDEMAFRSMGDNVNFSNEFAGSGGGGGASDDIEVDTSSLSMFQGVHMIQQFKRRSIFQQFRDDFEVERRKVAKTHTQGEADYNEALGNLKTRQLEKYVHAFFTSNTLPPSIYGLRTWWADPKTVQMPEMLLMSDKYSPFCNFMLRRYKDIDAAFHPGRQMEAAMLGHIASPAGFCHEMRMRPAVLYLGPASTGKSYVLDIAKKLMPPGTTAEVVYRTAKSGLTETDETDRVVIEQEVSRELLGVDKMGNSIGVDPWIKNMFNNQVLTARYMEHRSDPETGAVIREDKMCAKRYEVSFLGASNDPVTGREDAMIERFIKYTMHASTEEDQRIVALMEMPEWTTPTGLRKEVCEQYQSFYCLVAFAEKAIESNAIEKPNMDAVCEMKHLLEYVNQKYGMYTDNPKSFDKMFALCRCLTIQYAVYAAVCSENGRGFRFFESTGELRRLDKDFPLAVDVLKAIESYAVCTREIVVYVFSMLRSEWLDETFQKVFDAVRHMYMGQDSQLTTASAVMRRHCLFGGPKNSILYSELELDPKKTRDATYLIIEPEGSSQTTYYSIASTIHNAIPGERIPVEDLQKILRRMSRTRVTGSLYAIDTDTLDHKTVPREMSDEEADEVVRHEFSMVTCQPVEPYAGPISKNSTHAPTDIDQSHANGNNFGFGRGSGGFNDAKGRKMWFGIAYDLLREKRCSKHIIEDAISSLGHFFQPTDEQILVLSLPVEREVVRAAEIKGRRYGRTSKKVKTTFYSFPALYTMKWENRFRFVNNPNPILEGTDQYLRMFETGPRAESAKRRCMMSSASSPALWMDVDPDIAAMSAHHVRCGIPVDLKKHPTGMLDDMVKIFKAVMPGHPFIDYEKEIQDAVNSWNNKREIATLGRHVFNSAQDLQRTAMAIGPAMGRISQTISAARMRTDTEINMGMDRDQIHHKQNIMSDNLFNLVIKTNPDIAKRFADNNIDPKAFGLGESVDSLIEMHEGQRNSSSDDIDGAIRGNGDLILMPPPSSSNSASSVKGRSENFGKGKYSKSSFQRYNLMRGITNSLSQDCFGELGAMDAASAMPAAAKQQPKRSRSGDVKADHSAESNESETGSEFSEMMSSSNSISNKRRVRRRKGEKKASRQGSRKNSREQLDLSGDGDDVGDLFKRDSAPKSLYQKVIEGEEGSTKDALYMKTGMEDALDEEADF